MAKKLKVGKLIGVGGIVATHFPDGKAVRTRNWSRSQTSIPPPPNVLRKEQQGIELVYEKPDDLIANKDIDIVDVCTPNAYHAPLSIKALEAGKHVICEKPLAPTPADIRNMIAARNKSGKLLMTAQHFPLQRPGEAGSRRSKSTYWKRWAKSTTREAGCCGAAARRCGRASIIEKATAAAARASTSACIFSTSRFG